MTMILWISFWVAVCLTILGNTENAPGSVGVACRATYNRSTGLVLAISKVLADSSQTTPCPINITTQPGQRLLLNFSIISLGRREPVDEVEELPAEEDGVDLSLHPGTQHRVSCVPNITVYEIDDNGKLSLSEVICDDRKKLAVWSTQPRVHIIYNWVSGKFSLFQLDYSSHPTPGLTLCQDARSGYNSSQKCNGVADCSDSSDERDCPQTPAPTKTATRPLIDYTVVISVGGAVTFAVIVGVVGTLCYRSGRTSGLTRQLTVTASVVQEEMVFIPRNQCARRDAHLSCGCGKPTDSQITSSSSPSILLSPSGVSPISKGPHAIALHDGERGRPAQYLPASAASTPGGTGPATGPLYRHSYMDPLLSPEEGEDGTVNAPPTLPASAVLAATIPIYVCKGGCPCECRCTCSVRDKRAAMRDLIKREKSHEEAQSHMLACPTVSAPLSGVSSGSQWDTSLTGYYDDGPGSGRRRRICSIGSLESSAPPTYSDALHSARR